MAKIIPITNEPKQSFNYDLEDNLIEIEVEFLTIPQRWQMSVTYNDNVVVNGMLLTADILQLKGYELPFDVVIEDLQGLGIAPFDINNFQDGYYQFNILTNDDMTELRGYEVPL